MSTVPDHDWLTEQYPEQIMDHASISNVRIVGTLTLTAIATASLTGTAAAHHAMGGETPATFVQGFVSGLAHPVIGLDHLAFVLAAGILGYMLARPLSVALSFITATIAGTAIHVMGYSLPYAEFAIAGSVLAAAAAIFSGTLAPRAGIPVTAAIAVAGLFHGYAYGESIVGAEPAPLAAYLAGFSAIQIAILLSVAGLLDFIARRRMPAQATHLARLAGLAVAATGLATLAAQAGIL
ncbi:MAG: hypothetical protein RLZ98_571 [Pseudomonadota bacterium]